MVPLVPVAPVAPVGPHVNASAPIAPEEAGAADAAGAHSIAASGTPLLLGYLELLRVHGQGQTHLLQLGQTTLMLGQTWRHRHPELMLLLGLQLGQTLHCCGFIKRRNNFCKNINKLF